MNKIKEVLLNINSIGFFLSSKTDIKTNHDLRKQIEVEEKNVITDVFDLKVSDLRHNLDLLQKEMEKELSRPSKFLIEIKVFVASSSKLEEEREAIIKLLSTYNDKLVKKGIYLKCNVWEKIDIDFKHFRKQDEYNKKLVNKSDIFICIIGDTVGKFTKEEFKLALKRFELSTITKPFKPYVMKIYFKEYKNPPKALRDSPAFKKRDKLKLIVSEHEQVYGSFVNTHDLIIKIGEHLPEEIKKVREQIEKK